MSAPIRFVCAGCGKKLAAAVKYAGRSFACPACHVVAKVPEIEEPPIVLEAVPDLPPLTAHVEMPSPREVSSTFEEAQDKHLAAKVTDRCPYCSFVYPKPPKRGRKCKECGEKFHVRYGHMLTVAETKEFDEKFANAYSWMTPDDKFAMRRAQAKRDLDICRRLWQQGLAEHLLIECYNEEMACDFCKRMAKAIPIATATVEMLPPYRSCANFLRARSGDSTAEVCPCVFGALMGTRKLPINFPFSTPV